MTGVIKRIVPAKGFGFIKPDDQVAGEELFFHRSACMSAGPGAFDLLAEGQRVTFEEGQSVKGPRAEQVRPV